MGVVYEARDPERGLNVAMKCLVRFDARSLLRMKEEFRGLRDLRHPNLVALGELIEDVGQWFFTMELVEGIDFCSYARGATVMPLNERDTDAGSSQDKSTMLTSQRGISSSALQLPPQGGALAPAVDEARLRTALLGLAEGLSALHAAGKVHRDIKPSNVLVTAAGRAVLLDFGLVTDAHLQATGPDAGLVMGTPAYMAPEQTLAGGVGPPADWYSVGVMLYEVLVGRRPLMGENADVIAGKRHFEPPAPSEVVAGVPADLSELCKALLRLDPGARPDAREVLARLGAPLAERRKAQAAPAAAGQHPFVGRARERDVLQGAFGQFRLGKPVFLLVQGESGVGKSALVAHFLEQVRATAPDALALRGKCHERESVPYKAFDGVLDSLTRELFDFEPDALHALLPPTAAVLGQVFPVMQQLPALARLTEGAVQAPDAHEQRWRFFRAMREFLGRLGKTRPVVLAIDDLQWADADSFALLREVLRPPDAPRVLLICTVRAPPDRAWLPPNFTGDPGQHLILSPLDEQDALQLANALLARQGARTSGAAAWVASEAKGHPLFIQELVRSARSGPGSSRLALDESLWARVQELPPAARTVLSLAAVAGTPVANEAVSTAAGLAAVAYAQAVDALALAQLLRSQGVRRRDPVEPYHDRIREAVLQRLPAEDRSGLHERLARAHEALGTADSETLATHWLGAGQEALGLRYVLKAAAEADAALAFERASRLYRQALALTPQTDQTRASRVSLRRSLGESLTNAGREKEAGAVFLEAARLADSQAEIELTARAGSAFLRAGLVTEGCATMDRALKSVGMSLPIKSIWSTVGSFLWQRARIGLRRLRFTERPADQISAAELQRIDLMWSVSTGMAFVDAMIGSDFSARHLRFALDAGEPHRIARGLSVDYPYRAAITLRNPKKAREGLELARSLALRLDDAHALGSTYLHEAGTYYLNEGAFRTVFELSEKSMEIFRNQCHGVFWELALTREFSNSALYSLGEWAELSRRVKTELSDALEREDLLARTNLTSGGMNVIWLVDDDVEEAARRADSSLAHWPKDRFYLANFLYLIASTNVDLYAGRPRAAADRFDQQWRALARSYHLTVPFLRYVMHDSRVRARLGTALEQQGSERKATLKLATAAARRLGKGGLSWSRATEAMVLGTVAAMEGDAPRAIPLLEAAEQGFERADMKMLAVGARWRRGELMGGEAGTALRAQAEAAMLAQGVRAPAKMVNIVAPGFSAP